MIRGGGGSSSSSRRMRTAHESSASSGSAASDCRRRLALGGDAFHAGLNPPRPGGPLLGRKPAQLGQPPASSARSASTSAFSAASFCAFLRSAFASRARAVARSQRSSGGSCSQRYSTATAWIVRSQASTVPSRARMRPRGAGSTVSFSTGRKASARKPAPLVTSNCTARPNTTSNAATKPARQIRSRRRGSTTAGVSVVRWRGIAANRRAWEQGLGIRDWGLVSRARLLAESCWTLDSSPIPNP